MGILSQVSATQVDWSGRDGLQPSEADSGFTQTASSSANVYMSDEALVMETPPDGGASLEYAFSLSEAGAPIVIEVEASSVSERDAAAIKVLSGVNGVSTWLFEASNLRIVMSSAESSVYVPVKTGDRHVYRYEIEGVDVRILIDDRMVFEGVMTAPLKTAKLLIGNVSPGGGSMEIFRISISIPDGQSEMSGENEQNLMDQNPIAWDIPGDQPRAVFKDWPSNADAIIIEASYQASAARQCCFRGNVGALPPCKQAVGFGGECRRIARTGGGNSRYAFSKVGVYKNIFQSRLLRAHSPKYARC